METATHDFRLQVWPNTTGTPFTPCESPGAPVEPLYPGAAEAIATLARREDVVLGIATGKSQRGVRLVLGHHGLLDHFITIKTADDAPSKPDPGMVLGAMREAGVGAADTIVVGDTVYDIAMARAAGAAGLGVAWGYHPARSAERSGRARGDRSLSRLWYRRLTRSGPRERRRCSRSDFFRHGSPARTRLLRLAACTPRILA